ncbi:MAG: 30S ribosomal protein S9 [Candidatus Magasanikbacteria bacterium]|nr:30S ribosomal protein S9 [Candidatus Magasanikbacteria bacterium]
MTEAVKTTSDTTRAVGRRKEATARVRLSSTDKTFVVNGKSIETYFPYKLHQALIMAPLKLTGLEGTFGVSIKVEGGGVTGQAEAVRHGIARALVELNPELRAALKAVGYLRRDPRTKERKKPGLRKARRAPQWSKR